ncbi:MAG TPA: hypothetical protein VHG08_12385 [Longimicrobium sp.]|nr:hypothetical protein [Longimicrobium sp.]
MDASTAVERALPVFAAVAPNDWSALRNGLARAGVPQPLAGDVAAFMPIAFGRELLNGTGIKFSPEYAIHTAGAGAQVAGRLAGHPVYAAAAALATRMVERREGGDAFVAVAVWSSEFLAANEALNAGSELADLVAGPPVIINDDAPAPPAPETKRPWWRVWG